MKCCCFCDSRQASHFGRPVCASCHDFLFDLHQLDAMDNASSSNHSAGGGEWSNEKHPSDDSGKDESDEDETRAPLSSHQHHHRHHPPLPSTSPPVSPHSLLSNVHQSSLHSHSPNVMDNHHRQSSSSTFRPNAPSTVSLSHASCTSTSTSTTFSSFDMVNDSTKQLLSLVTAAAFPQPGRRQTTLLLDLLPIDVILNVLKFLDDIDLCSLCQLSHRLCGVIDMELSFTHWTAFIKKRWPLFVPLAQSVGKSGRLVYSNLMASVTCRTCLDNLWNRRSGAAQFNVSTASSFLNNNNNSGSSSGCPVVASPPHCWRYRRLRAEFRSLLTEPPYGIRLEPLDAGGRIAAGNVESVCQCQALICGPPGSPYEGGQFFLCLLVPPGYPMKPPLVRFITRIFHPNVSEHGDIGVDCIGHNWTLALTLAKILVSIQSLLTDPHVHVCMRPKIGRLWTENRSEYDRQARMWTRKYAMHDFLDPLYVAQLMQRNADQVDSL